MRLLVLSHKETWPAPASPSGYDTVGGFPFQMAAISELFDRTTVMVPLRTSDLPGGTKHLAGHNLTVRPLPEPAGRDLRRKIALLTWLPQYLPTIWRAVKQADAVHAPVPGDIGTIGILVALAQRKPLFIRHCGTWGNRTTLADRFLDWLLPRIAGGRNVVLATGGGDALPSPKKPNIHWIFSTTLSEGTLASLPAASPWQPDTPLRLVTVGRLTAEKNVAATLRALSLIKKQTKRICENPYQSVVEISLDILGDGKHRPALEKLTADLGITDHVTFHGNVSHAEVLRLLAQSHLFVFPTCVKEGFPKALLEALAEGLPVVATNVSVIPHLIKDCGYVLPDTTPEAVSQAVCELIGSPNTMQEMAQNARQTAGQYTLERWRDEIGTHLKAAWGPLSAQKNS